MHKEVLIDSQLIEILRQTPKFATSPETLQLMRDAVGAWRLKAPEAQNVRVEEVHIDGTNGRKMRALVYTPENVSPNVALLWIHGGGMVMGGPEINYAPNRFVAQAVDCVVVAVAYRLAPEHPYPAGFEDCLAALQWAHSQANKGEFPATRIAVAAESGGGALAAGLALYARDHTGIPLSSQFLMFPMLDDRTGTPLEIDPMAFAGEFVWDRESNCFCWNAVLGPRSSQAEIPIYAAPGRAESLVGMPPTFISIGDVDLFIGEDLRFAQRLIRDGVPTELHVYPGAAHGFTAWGADTEIAQRCQHEFWHAIIRRFRA